ncbi:MAG: prolipoprotein diacylglyceryl transferase [Hydrogenothermaceae bacterium]|nr:prolipoprotein diacylglyceryl transferase [Hydrogenothermaceae bacterium]
MFPDLITIGGFTIHTYGVLVAIGLLVGFYVGLYFAKKEGITEKDYENTFLITVFAGIFGARIAYIIEHKEEFNSVFDFVAIWNGGIDWFGGFIGGLVGSLAYLSYKKISLLKFADVAGIAIPIGHFFGRLGCTSAGCCHGKPVPEDSPFRDIAIIFPNDPHCQAPAGVPLYPTQPVEALGNLTIFFILFYIYRKKSFDGQIFSLYLVLYGLERFLLEFWRGVTPPIPGLGLTWNQIVTLGMVIFGLTSFFILKSRYNKQQISS